ncbi:hypothetical protein E4T44_00105 [Aureobasidium sp. EXF-8845]|nr:hypothetical protein E4T44_00105 [Aureobasidium sp. EXF-8845]KAI4858391.1 hypothetical protein E4T45_00090 [Aureobasidium sp. EXF-8846]
MGSIHVSWASPLIEPPIQHSRVPRHSSRVNASEPSGTSQTRRTAVESLRSILQGQPRSSRATKPTSRHDSLDLSNAVVISTPKQQERQTHTRQEKARTKYQEREEREKERYAQSRYDREQELLRRDAFYEARPEASPEDRTKTICWSAACKFINTLAFQNTESGPDHFFSESDLLVSLFIHVDRNVYNNGLLADELLRNLIADFPRVRNFRFAVFFPRELVENNTIVPEALRYLLGTFEYLQRTASMEGATTEMEQRFIARQHHLMRRCRYDHVEVHEDSLIEGILTPKVDADHVNSTPMQSHLLQDTLRPTSTQAINIVWPKRKDVADAWQPARKSFAWA